jgi:hypothetical protein
MGYNLDDIIFLLIKNKINKEITKSVWKYCNNQLKCQTSQLFQLCIF